MPALDTKKYIVIVRQGRIKPRGGVEGWLDRSFTAYAKTRRGAESSVRSAGTRGKIISVEKV